MSSPAITIACVSNLFVRQMHFKNAGDVELGHKHNFDHITLLARGSLRVRVGDEQKDFVAPCPIFIHKDIEHELTALEDNTIAHCIHALRDGNRVEDIVDPEMVPAPNHPAFGALLKSVRRKDRDAE